MSAPGFEGEDLLRRVKRLELIVSALILSGANADIDYLYELTRRSGPLRSYTGDDFLDLIRRAQQLRPGYPGKQGDLSFFSHRIDEQGQALSLKSVK